MNSNDRFGKGTHFAHLNIRSVFGGRKLDMLKCQIRDSQIDVFTLSETWPNPAVPDQTIDVPSYTVIRCDRSWSEPGSSKEFKRGGGLACFIRNNLRFSDTKYAEFNMSCKDLEMQWVEISPRNIRPILLINVYRPPQGNYKTCCDLIS